MDAFSMLIDEHKVILKVLKTLKKFRENIRKTSQNSEEFLTKTVDFFRTYADKCHHGKEENFLFKNLEKKPLKEEEKKILKELWEEHALARTLIASLEGLKKTKDFPALEELLDKILTLYTQHIQKENGKFFLPAFAYFSEEEKQEILKNFLGVDQKMIHKKYLKVAQELDTLIGS